MPELPEVQTVVSTLQKQIQNKTITDVIVTYPNIIEQDPKYFANTLKGKTFQQFQRRGKYIVLFLNEGFLVIHLRMEGRFYLYDQHQPSKHVHVVFVLDDQRYMHYHDTRKFGRMIYLEDRKQLDAYFSHMGMEVSDPAFDGRYLYRISRNKTRSIKSFLLSQQYIAGIGNIYADEICFAAKVHPNEPIDRISRNKWDKIASACRSILHEATLLGGSSIRSYTDSLGVTGRFQLQLKVHMKKGVPCPVCQTTIIKTVVANRGTYLCPTCQKSKK